MFIVVHIESNSSRTLKPRGSYKTLHHHPQYYISRSASTHGKNRISSQSSLHQQHLPPMLYSTAIAIPTDLANNTPNAQIPTYYGMCCAGWTDYKIIQAFQIARGAIQQRTNVLDNHLHLVRDDIRWKWCDCIRGDEFNEYEDMHNFTIGNVEY